MNRERLPKQIVTGRMGRKRKRARPWKRRTDEVEEDLKVMGISVVTDRKE